LPGIFEQHTEALSDKAREPILEASKRFMIFWTTLSPTVYIAVKDCGVTLTWRYLVDPGKRRGRQHALREAMLESLSGEKGIELAYPNARLFHSGVDEAGDAGDSAAPAPSKS
jgi:hypothetical protein